jgi:hypothetical protein
VPLLLALSLGGHSFAWSSPKSLGLFALAAVALALFFVVENRVSNPILPPHLFKNRTFSTANLAGFLISMAFMGVVMFLPLYLQLGMGVAATTSGLTMLPLMGGLIVGSTVSGQLVSKTGRYKPFMLGGAAVLLLGVSLLAFFLGSVSLPVLCLACCWWWAWALVPARACSTSPPRTPSSRATSAWPPAPTSSSARSARPSARPLAGALLTHQLASHGRSDRPGRAAGHGREGQRPAGGHAAVDPTLQNALIHAVQSVWRPAPWWCGRPGGDPLHPRPAAALAHADGTPVLEKEEPTPRARSSSSCGPGPLPAR